MTINQATTTAAGAVPGARAAPDAHPAVALPGSSAVTLRGAGDHVTVNPRSIVVLSDPRRD